MENVERCGGGWDKSEGEVISEKEKETHGLISNLKGIARIGVFTSL